MIFVNSAYDILYIFYIIVPIIYFDLIFGWVSCRSSCIAFDENIIFPFSVWSFVKYNYESYNIYTIYHNTLLYVSYLFVIDSIFMEWYNWFRLFSLGRLIFSTLYLSSMYVWIEGMLISLESYVCCYCYCASPGTILALYSGNTLRSERAVEIFVWICGNYERSSN